MRRLALSAALVLSACATEPPPPCEEFGVARAGGGTLHTASCDDPSCGNGFNPPTAGPHCGTTLSCRTFTTEQPRCSWIHNLEHGHLVLLYNCPEGCPDELAQLQAIYDEALSPKRVLLTPDPQLPTRFAAVVWGTSWSADELNVDAVRCLQGLQDDDAPEPFVSCTP